MNMELLKEFVCAEARKRELEVADEVAPLCYGQNILFSEQEVRAVVPVTLREALKISFVHS